jgi:hypothetical protein
MGFGRGAGFRDPANHVDLKQAVLECGAVEQIRTDGHYCGSSGGGVAPNQHG